MFLGSEGIGHTVLANSVEDFLALLAIGYEELGFDDWSVGPKEETEGLQEFRNWLNREFGIVAPERGLEIIEDAKAHHPNLNEWFRDWQEEHFRHKAV